MDEEYSVGSVEASGAWSWVSDQVVAGLCHDLSDRLSSLMGLLQLAELDGAIEPSVGAPFRSELERVEELVRLFRLLPGGRTERAEPVRLVEALPVVSALLRRHRGLESMRLVVETGADPVIRARWGTLVRLLLLLAATAARGARAAGSTEVLVRIGSTESSAVVELMVPVEVEASSGSLGAESTKALAESTTAVLLSGAGLAGVTEALRVDLEAAGGALAASGSSLSVSFPLFGV
jgi:hypothetical protein